jgi:hypothetical protein
MTKTDNSDDTKTKPKLSKSEEKEKAAAAKEANCEKNNKTTSSRKETLGIIDQIKLTFKVYRKIIMIIMTIYLLMDVSSTLGHYALVSCIFAVIVMAYFTKVYDTYKISACDNFTEGLVGLMNTNRDCHPLPGTIGREDPPEREPLTVANVVGV